MTGVAKELFLRLEPLRLRFADLSSFVDLVFFISFFGEISHCHHHVQPPVCH